MTPNALPNDWSPPSKQPNSIIRTPNNWSQSLGSSLGSLLICWQHIQSMTSRYQISQHPLQWLSHFLMIQPYKVGFTFIWFGCNSSLEFSEREGKGREVSGSNKVPLPPSPSRKMCEGPAPNRSLYLNRVSFTIFVKPLLLGIGIGLILVKRQK